MSFAKLRQDYTPLPAPSAQLTTQLEGIAPTHSPALALQQKLAAGTSTSPSPEIRKWSPRSSLALIVSASIALWMAILMSVGEAAKLLA